MAGLASEFLEFYGALRRTTSMNTKAKAPPLGGEAQAGSWLTPPWTLEERLRRIETMAQRINGYIGFMSQGWQPERHLHRGEGECRDGLL
jgi:hypothetical protein